MKRFAIIAAVTGTVLAAMPALALDQVRWRAQGATDNLVVRSSPSMATGSDMNCGICVRETANALGVRLTLAGEDRGLIVDDTCAVTRMTGIQEISLRCVAGSASAPVDCGANDSALGSLQCE